MLGLGISKKVNFALAHIEQYITPQKYRFKSSFVEPTYHAKYGTWFQPIEGISALSFTNTEKILKEAQLCINHQFDILGSGLRDRGISMNWHIDIKSGRLWPIKYYKKLRYNLSGAKGSDVKIPWELSRFQHLITLVKAYLVTRNLGYAKEAIVQISDWIKHNPFLYGVNWTSAMEVSIRSSNWIWAWWAFHDCPSWSKSFDQEFIKSIWQHGSYIEDNLEDKGGVRTNHYLSNIVGLLFIGTMFPHFKEAKRWQQVGVNEMAKCMDEMVYPDGVSFENSTAYHRLVLELFSFSAILCQLNNIDLPGPFWKRLEKMFEFVLYCMRPDGHLPMIGDSDDSRFFILADYYQWDRWDFRYLLAIGAAIFNRDDFARSAGNSKEELSWVIK